MESDENDITRTDLPLTDTTHTVLASTCQQ